MGDNTAIEWADATWNPIIGCSRVGPGCDHCYAIGVVHRAMSPQHVGLTVHPEGGPTDWTGEVREVPHMLDQPLRWTRPRRIFVNSLSDLFHPDVSKRFIAKVFATMAMAPEHTFQVLTKRPQRMRELLNDSLHWSRVMSDVQTAGADVPAGVVFGKLPNVWLGTSIETDRYSFRADHLRDTPAAVRWISAEPLLGPLPSLDLTGIDWVVAGGESGPGARPMHPDWARDLRDRCSASPSTAFLFKQWGNWVPMDDPIEPEYENRAICIESDGTNVAWLHTPLDDEAVTLVNVGKKAAGRVLDGRTWDEYPDQPTPAETPAPADYLARTVCVPQPEETTK